MPQTRFSIGAGVTLAELEHDPHPALARLRAEEPVSYLPALGGWLVSRRDLALQVMRDAATFTVDDERFSTARVVGPSMLSRDGAEHARHRDPFAGAFRLAEVRTRFTAAVAAEAQRLVAALGEHGRADLRPALCAPLAVAVVAAALGLEDADEATVRGWYDAIVEAVGDVTAGRPPRPAGAAAVDELRRSVEATLAHDGSPSLLAAALGEGAAGLDAAEVVSNAAVLMFGGIETTDGMIANVVLHLLSNPDELARVRADGALIAGAIEESLRLEPAAAVVDRYATRDVMLADAAIERGDLVVVSIAGANRDPDAFADPDRYDVGRENARLQVAFAHGPHVCLGMHLARLETRAAVEALLAALPGLRLDPQRPSRPRGLIFRKPAALWVTY